MSHVSLINTLRPTYEWITPHSWMSHVTLMNKSRFTRKWFMSREWVTSHLCIFASHSWMNHVTVVIESRHTHEQVVSYVWMSHVTRTDFILIQLVWHGSSKILSKFFLDLVLFVFFWGGNNCFNLQIWHGGLIHKKILQHTTKHRNTLQHSTTNVSKREPKYVKSANLT